MLRKLFLGCALFTMSIFNVASAEHDDNDPYEAMCQSTGTYAVKNDASKYFAPQKGYFAVQLFGHCGEQPNELLLDSAKLNSENGTEEHSFQVWHSPKNKQGNWWRMVYSKDYVLNKAGNVLSSRLGEKKNDEWFLDIKSERVGSFVISPFTCAKKGGPLFPDARGQLVCGLSEPIGNNVLEQGYIEYMATKSKK